jgi:hypothetical protein
MTDKPSVLVGCVHNAGRSQMAAALAAMAEEGIDMSAEVPNSALHDRGCSWGRNPPASSRHRAM